MTKINLNEHFVDKTASLKWVPCQRLEDYAIMQKINQEMQGVKREFAHKSAQSITLAHDMILRRSR